MERWLGNYSKFIYALMRMVVGLLFTCHGAQKLFSAFGGHGLPSSHLIVTAAVIEFFGGGLVAIGLWAGYAAFVTSGQMAVAYFMEHASDGFWPIVNKGELAVLYCFIFLYIACRGSGNLSVDALTKKRHF